MRALTIATLAVSLALSMQARAEGPQGGAVTLARNAADEGLRLFSAGKWREAYETFRTADGAFHAPTFILYMAHCQRMLGKLVAARQLYQKVIDEPIAPGAPDQFHAAQAMARDEIERLGRRISSLEITLDGPVPRGARVLIDGVEVPAIVKGTHALDPGNHDIEIQVDGAPPVRRSTTLAEGKSAALSIPVPDAPAPNPDPAPTATRASRAPAIAAFAISAAATGFGAVAGAISLSQAAGAKAGCRGDGHCPAADEPKAALAGRWADASTALLVIGGAAAASGVVLWLVPRSSSSGAEVRAGLGPRGAFISGAF